MIQYDKKTEAGKFTTENMEIGDTGIIIGELFVGTPVMKIFSEHNSPKSKIVSLAAGITWSNPSFPVRLCDFKLTELKQIKEKP